MYFKTCRNFILGAGADAHENTFSFGTFVDAGHIIVDAFSAFGKQTYVYDTCVDAFSVFGIFFDVF